VTFFVHQGITQYNVSQSPPDRDICGLLATEIAAGLPDAENKIWHAHPVWFLDGNPIVGYNKMKGCVRLMFWSGASFDETELKPGTGRFQDASIRYRSADEIEIDDLRRWLQKARDIQWDYKNVVKRKGVLEKIR
jgi:hypothetical protein